MTTATATAEPYRSESCEHDPFEHYSSDAGDGCIACERDRQQAAGKAHQLDDLDGWTCPPMPEQDVKPGERIAFTLWYLDSSGHKRDEPYKTWKGVQRAAERMRRRGTFPRRTRDGMVYAAATFLDVEVGAMRSTGNGRPCGCGCELPIPASRRADAQYATTACRMRAHRRMR